MAGCDLRAAGGSVVRDTLSIASLQAMFLLPVEEPIDPPSGSSSSNAHLLSVEAELSQPSVSGATLPDTGEPSPPVLPAHRRRRPS